METAPTQWIDGIGRLDEHPLGETLVKTIAEVCSGAQHTGRTRDLLRLLELQPGQAILEVGCGTGAVLREIVRSTQGRVRVTGIDPSHLALAQAERDNAAGLGGLTAAVALRHMDGAALAFPNGSFAAALSSRVLIHAAEPERIVSEMARVVQPGGRVLCIEPAAQLSAGVEDALRRTVSAWTNPDVGRALLGIMRRAGLTDVTITLHAAVSIDPPDVAAWRAEFAAGRGSRAASVHDGRCTAADVEELFSQTETAIQSGEWLECAVHFAALGHKAL